MGMRSTAERLLKPFVVSSFKTKQLNDMHPVIPMINRQTNRGKAIPHLPSKFKPTHVILLFPSSDHYKRQQTQVLRLYKHVPRQGATAIAGLKQLSMTFEQA